MSVFHGNDYALAFCALAIQNSLLCINFREQMHEFYLFIHSAEKNGINVDRVYCGSFITSLEMAGVSLTVLHLNEQRKRCLGI